MLKSFAIFTDTKINTDNIVLTTNFSSHDIPGFVADPDQIKDYVHNLWLDANSVATGTTIKDTIVIDQKFDYLLRNESGQIVAVVVDSDGNTEESVVDFYKTPSQTLVTDGQGDSLVITKDQKIMGIEEYKSTGGNNALLNEYHRKQDSLAQWTINFLPYKKQEFTFDYLASGNHGIFSTSELYPK